MKVFLIIMSGAVRGRIVLLLEKIIIDIIVIIMIIIININRKIVSFCMFAKIIWKISVRMGRVVDLSIFVKIFWLGTATIV